MPFAVLKISLNHDLIFGENWFVDHLVKLHLLKYKKMFFIKSDFLLETTWNLLVLTVTKNNKTDWSLVAKIIAWLLLCTAHHDNVIIIINYSLSHYTALHCTTLHCTAHHDNNMLCNYSSSHYTEISIYYTALHCTSLKIQSWPQQYYLVCTTKTRKCLGEWVRISQLIASFSEKIYQ